MAIIHHGYNSPKESPNPTDAEPITQSTTNPPSSIQEVDMPATKVCIDCGKNFEVTGKHQKRCKDCGSAKRKHRATESLHKPIVQPPTSESDDESALLVDSYRLIKKLRTRRFELTFNGVHLIVEKL